MMFPAYDEVREKYVLNVMILYTETELVGSILACLVALSIEP
jgi:hypothetical protein